VPPGRWAHALGVDTFEHVYMYGGETFITGISQSDTFSDLWEYVEATDPTQPGVWTLIDQTSSLPFAPPHGLAGTSYSMIENNFILVGGISRMNGVVKLENHIHIFNTLVSRWISVYVNNVTVTLSTQSDGLTFTLTGWGFAGENEVRISW